MTGTKLQGNLAEEHFVSLVQSLGLSVKKSSRSEDMRQHIDFWVLSRDEWLSVDVKARKRLQRASTVLSDDLLFIEFKNVRGDPGWLYGQANIIAFEQVDGFILVNRVDLLDLAETKIMNDYAKSPSLYRLYRRFDRPDESVGLIRSNDLFLIPFQQLRDKGYNATK